MRVLMMSFGGRAFCPCYFLIQFCCLLFLNVNLCLKICFMSQMLALLYTQCPNSANIVVFSIFISAHTVYLCKS